MNQEDGKKIGRVTGASLRSDLVCWVVASYRSVGTSPDQSPHQMSRDGFLLAVSRAPHSMLLPLPPSAIRQRDARRLAFQDKLFPLLKSPIEFLVEKSRFVWMDRRAFPHSLRQKQMYDLDGDPLLTKQADQPKGHRGMSAPVGHRVKEGVTRHSGFGRH